MTDKPERIEREDEVSIGELIVGLSDVAADLLAEREDDITRDTVADIRAERGVDVSSAKWEPISPHPAFVEWFNSKHDWDYDQSCKDLYERLARHAFIAGWDGRADITDARIAELEAEYLDSLIENARLRETLRWYAEQTRLCRLIHSEGDQGRSALADDGGKRAMAALKPKGLCDG